MNYRNILLGILLFSGIALFGDIHVSDKESLEKAIIFNNTSEISSKIVFDENLFFHGFLRPLNVDDNFIYQGKSFCIDGNQKRLSLVDSRAFFIGGNLDQGKKGGVITIENLIISEGKAKGGNSGTSSLQSLGGGGAGLGGGLFVGKGASVALSNVTFCRCKAEGGTSKANGMCTETAAGGSGMGGDGADGGHRGYGGGGGGGMFYNGGDGYTKSEERFVLSGGGGGGGCGNCGKNSSLAVSNGGEDKATFFL